MNQIAPVLDIISSLSAPAALDELLAEFIAKTVQLAGADGGTVFKGQAKSDTIIVLANYVSPAVSTPFGDVSHQGAAYPLAHYPAMAQALRAQTPLLVRVDDPAVAEADKELLSAFHWTGALLIPMARQQQAVGLLSLYVVNWRDGQFTAEVVQLCQTLANQAALILENDRLYHEVEDGQLIAEAMQVIGRALASELDYERIVRNVADFAYRLVNAQFVYVAVPENEGFRLVARAGWDRPDTGAGCKSNATLNFLDHHPLAQAVREKRPIIIADTLDRAILAPGPEKDGSDWRAMVAAPLLSHNRVVGVLAAYAVQPNCFKANDVATLMSLASQAAVAIQNAQFFAQLGAQRQELRQVSLRLVNAQEEERRRISRELHDELGQALTALKINLDVARRSLPPEAAPKLKQSVHEAGSLAVQTLEIARNLSLELHPAILDDLGLVSALRWEVDRYEQRTGQAVHLKTDLADAALQPELEITIYRLIIEALTNVARHAQADSVLVQVGVKNGQVIIRVEDDGVGFDMAGWLSSPAARQSLGLVSMRERAGLLGGQLDVISQPGLGTRILAKLPLSR
ncbi:MAG: GAF domain-containing sensor histidine kinase [Anaerolineae bacterium]|nr:GAF domain-containing sensor histidine kinase [Anaerolineae bacterium]